MTCPTKHAFESDLEFLLTDPIKVCIFGHTHENYDETLKSGVRVISNLNNMVMIK